MHFPLLSTPSTRARNNRSKCKLLQKQGAWCNPQSCCKMAVFKMLSKPSCRASHRSAKKRRHNFIRNLSPANDAHIWQHLYWYTYQDFSLPMKSFYVLQQHSNHIVECYELWHPQCTLFHLVYINKIHKIETRLGSTCHSKQTSITRQTNKSALG